MRFYFLTAGLFFSGLVGIALAGAGPEDSVPQTAGCHGAAAPAASCHGEEAAASCHGRSTFAERRASRVAARADARAARADSRAERAAARGCHGQQAKASCHGEAPAAPACECAEDCACRN